MARPGHPAHFHYFCEGSKQWSPDRSHLGVSMHGDLPEQGARMVKAGQCRGDEINRPFHRRRHMPQDIGFKTGDGGDPPYGTQLSGIGNYAKVDACRPCFAQSCGRSAGKAREFLNTH